MAELTYRFDLRQSALFIHPDFQYVVQSGGTGRLNNARQPATSQEAARQEANVS